MSVRRIFLSTVAASLFTLLATCSPASADDVMARFIGVNQPNGQPMVVAVQLLNNGRRVTLTVPNETMKRGDTGAPQPKKEIAAVVRKLSPGAIIKVSADGTKGDLISIEEYDAKPGEDTPNGYVFSKTYDNPKDNTTLVVLTKLGVEYKFTILMKKVEKGKPEQDPDVVAAIGKLQSGNTVWVQTQGPVSKPAITLIEPYVDPLSGTLVKVGETEIDGHKVPSAEVKTDGDKTVTLLVPMTQVGKTFVADKNVKAELGKIKKNSPVLYRVHEDGDKLWLREIVAGSPKAAMPKAEPEKKDPPKKK